MTELLIDRLIRHEGIRLQPYKDTVGKLTIGIGRNLDDEGISHDEALYMLGNDVHNVQHEAAKAFPWLLGIDDTRQSVIYEMIFQLGINGVLGFPKMLAAMRIADWPTASNQMLNSKWHTETSSRCEELAEIMRTGT